LTDIAGYGVTVSDISLLFFYLLIAKKLIWDGVEVSFSFTPPLVFLFILMGVVFLSGISPMVEGQSTWIVQFFKSFSHLLFLILFTLICAIYPIKLNEWSGMLKALIFVSLIINIFGIYQMVARAYDWPLAWITLNNVSFNRGDIEGSKMEYKQLSLSYGNFFRATSIFSEPSALGAFNSYILSLLLIPIVYKLKNFVKSRLLWIILLIMSSAAALFTFSMTAFVGFLMVFSGFILTQRPKNLTRFFLIAVSIVLVIIVADAIISQSLNVSVIELFTKRIEGIASFGSGQKEVFGESFGVRLKSSEKAIEIWKEYPISGIGLGLTAYNKLNDLQFADMSFFALIAELGTIGTLAYLLFFISIVYLPFRLIKNKTNHTLFDDNDKRILFVPFFMMLVQIILNFISGNNFINFNFWGFSGFVLSILNTVYLKQGYRIVNLRLVRTPLKQQLAGLFSRPEIKD
jgi:hypothetical protein